jgi:hypothetical protein
VEIRYRCAAFAKIFSDELSVAHLLSSTKDVVHLLLGRQLNTPLLRFHRHFSHIKKRIGWPFVARVTSVQLSIGLHVQHEHRHLPHIVATLQESAIATRLEERWLSSDVFGYQHRPEYKSCSAYALLSLQASASPHGLCFLVRERSPSSFCLSPLHTLWSVL